MHLKIPSRLSLVLLTIIELCSSIPDLTDQQINTNNALFNANQKYNKFISNSKYNVIDDNIANIISDNSETNAIRRLKDPDESSADTSFGYVNTQTDDNSQLNFFITNYLPDGEIERRVHFNGITAKETRLSNAG